MGWTAKERTEPALPLYTAHTLPGKRRSGEKTRAKVSRRLPSAFVPSPPPPPRRTCANIHLANGANNIGDNDTVGVVQHCHGGVRPVADLNVVERPPLLACVVKPQLKGDGSKGRPAVSHKQGRAATGGTPPWRRGSPSSAPASHVAVSRRGKYLRCARSRDDGHVDNVHRHLQAEHVILDLSGGGSVARQGVRRARGRGHEQKHDSTAGLTLRALKMGACVLLMSQMRRSHFCPAAAVREGSVRHWQAVAAPTATTGRRNLHRHRWQSARAVSCRRGRGWPRCAP